MGSSRISLLVVSLSLVAQAGSAQTVRVGGVDSLTVGGLVQGQFNTTSARGPEPETQWEIRRARIRIDAFVAGWLSARVEGDFGRGNARLTDGYVDLAFHPLVQIRAGQYKVPFDVLELTSSSRLPVIERDGVPRGSRVPTPHSLLDDLDYNSRDIGASWTGDWDRWTATAGVFNGSGDNEREEDNGKQLAARLTAELGEEWSAAAGWTAIRVGDPPAADEARWYQAAELAVTAGEYLAPGWRLIGQALIGDNYDPDLFGSDDTTFLALQAVVSYHMPLYETPYLIGWEPVGRIGWLRFDDVPRTIEAGTDGTSLFTGGVNLYWRELVVTQAQVDVVHLDEDGSDAAFRIQMGFAF